MCVHKGKVNSPLAACLRLPFSYILQPRGVLLLPVLLSCLVVFQQTQQHRPGIKEQPAKHLLLQSIVFRPPVCAFPISVSLKNNKSRSSLLSPLYFPLTFGWTCPVKTFSKILRLDPTQKFQQSTMARVIIVAAFLIAAGEFVQFKFKFFRNLEERKKS